MNHPVGKVRFLILCTVLGTLTHCTGNPPAESPKVNTTQETVISQDQDQSRIEVAEFGESNEIRSAGLHLMDQGHGLIEIAKEEQFNDSVLVVAIHGYQSEGYEWITGIKNLAEHYGSLFFYRYDWDRCPEETALDLTRVINAKFKAGKYQKVVLFGHSYGGLVVTYAAAGLNAGDVEINVIAAPLSGISSLLKGCESLEYNDQGKLKYPQWEKSVRVIQHRTVHGQDGAFRDLKLDPQEIDLPFHKVQKLPPTMDGHRLGHNWSVTWVLDQYVGKPHRY